MVSGLVELGFYSWREVMDMDIENAINTFCIHYYKNFREILEYKEAENKAKMNHKF
ncbi:hypothetical protein [Helicobacter rodentium]|uniref:hypothetical protein n=1 Tax=Helicobacter rodentium TaxID=59617 RepID=UPI0025A5B5C1|nr:hypothetical protein [Helicobacter rodentium]